MIDPNSQTGALSAHNLQDTALNIVENVCGIFSRPVDIIIRPWHGTRYFSIVVIFLSSGMMIFLPVFATLATVAFSMVPFARIQMPMGLFDIGSLAKLYFLLSLIHGVRLYRRMINMSLETNSMFEGPPLPFFPLFPKGNNFWFTRIVLEPVFVLFTAMVLGHMYIFSSGLVLYLQLAALALAMKNFIGWYRAWEYIRNLMDMRFAGPIIAKLAENQATEEDLASVHLASFPKDLPPDFRKAAVSHIARAFSPDGETTTEESTVEGVQS
jgi:hypothetical protein